MVQPARGRETPAPHGPTATRPVQPAHVDEHLPQRRERVGAGREQPLVGEVGEVGVEGLVEVGRQFDAAGLAPGGGGSPQEPDQALGGPRGIGGPARWLLVS